MHCRAGYRRHPYAKEVLYSSHSWNKRVAARILLLHRFGLNEALDFWAEERYAVSDFRRKRQLEAAFTHITG